ncbi:FAD binding domain-containing protein [Talaromyces proteolyticus]|uniref:FAD binding domain-containing protein n=1 Tax=Talaromyces proteolyticus TaxID=1131652 RepID=A0AAD4L8L7_9EURO|nr:FAD binding domain-containing protein [Talaromyces proteolyticus]KAH8705904.1 FAD binding domain-containing protein [Talaromyces proteolyticus]
MGALDIPSTIPDSLPVIVVGAGPVGLSLAIELRLHGIDVLVVERELEIVDGHPKGRGNDLRTLEHYHRWGVSSELHRLAWQTRNPNQKVIITQTINEQPLGAYPLRYGRHIEESQEYAAEPSLSVPQPILMRVLQKRAIELGAQIRRGWEAISIKLENETVVAELQSPTGIIHRVYSDYLIGCDGPGSQVRKAAGISQKGVGPIARADSYVVRSKGYKIRDMISSPAHDALAFLMVLNPKVCTIISIPDEENWGFSIMSKDNDPSPPNEKVQQVGQNILGANVPLEVISSSSFRVFTRIAESYSTGRLFIAGDAAHLCPPTGGHNMNIGIGDVVNLGWKLAAVLNGWGGEKLLSTYDSERRPVGDRVCNSAMENSYLMQKAANLFSELPPLGADSSQEQRFRRGETAYQATFQQWNSLGITLGQRYDDSPLTIKDCWEDPPYSAVEYWHYACPGHRAPHLWLDDGSPLLDHFGKGFTLLDVQASEVQVKCFLDAADRVGLPITWLKLPARIARTKYPASITIIRPDQYISWQGDGSDDPSSIIDSIRGS